MPQPTGDSATDRNHTLRQRWISACARTSHDDLEVLAKNLHLDPQIYDVLRPAENGLVMVRARAGGTGQLFNTGEMTVTRCSVRGADGHVGHGYVAGRNRAHAELAARLDAHFQTMSGAQAEPHVQDMEMRIAAEARRRQQKSAPTRVEFFTMVRGEDE